MGNRRRTMQRFTALLLIFLLVAGNVAQAFAATLEGTIKESTKFTFTYVGYSSTNYHFTLESEDDKTWHGTCMDPNDQGIPQEGMKVNMSKVADDAMIARIAYEGTLRTDLSVGQRRYIISRAAAYHLGRIDSYSLVEEVDKLLKAAKNRSSIPENFVVYKTAESDYGQQILAWRTIKPTTIEVKKKTESTTSHSLAGAKYGLYSSKANANGNTNRIDTMTTDKNGNTNTITLYFTGEKTYYVKEYKAPDHLGLDETLYSKTLKEGGSWTIQSVEPLLEGSAKVKKVTTAETIPEGLSIAGAVYGIYKTKANANNDENRLKTLTTKENGVSNTVKLDAGTYYVKEVSCPDWLLKDKTVHTVTVTADKTATVNSTDPVKPGKLKVQKQLDVSEVPEGQNLEGAVYGIYNTREAAEANGEKGRIDTLTTDEKGMTKAAELDPGTYYVREVSCPDWLELDENIYTAEITYAQTKTFVVQSTDRIKPGFVMLKKTVDGPADHTIAGAEYGVYATEADAAEDSMRIGTLVTDVSGNTNQIQVDAGKTYYVKEQKAPAHYQLDEKIYAVYVPYGDGVTATVTSVEISNSGQVQIAKTIKTVAPYSKKDYSKAGARYGIFLSKKDAETLNEELALEVLVTDAAGNTPVSKHLQPGTYYVRETKAPDYLELDNETHTVNVKSDEVATVESVEPVSTGIAKVKKTAAHSGYVLSECGGQYSLAGAEYTVYAKPSLTSGSKAGTLITDEKGNSNELTLTAGEYWIIETKASPGFHLDGQGAVKILVEPNKVTEHKSAEPPLMDPINIVLNKTAGNDKENVPPLNGAQFQVCYYPVITENVDGLEPAKTWLFESKMEDGKGVIRFHDNYLIGGDALYKDENGVPAGLIGTYVITEEKAPAGYVKDPTPRFAYVNADGTVTNPKVSYMNQPTVPNQPKEFRLKLEKQDQETGKTAQGDATLEGAVFGLYRDGKLLEKLTTGADDTFTSAYYNIGDGSQKYTLRELEAPKGYLPHTMEYSLSELENDGITIQYTTVDKIVKNEVIKGSIAITKFMNAQASGGGLTPEEGVSFEVYLTSAGSYEAAKDSEKQTIVTNAEGFAETKMLPYGMYTVHQKNTTEGFKLCPDFTVNINEHDKTYSYTLHNDQYVAEVSVTKVDAETGKVIPVSGAVFKLRKAGASGWIGFPSGDSGKEMMTEFMTDKKGKFRFPSLIPYGSYELVEMTAPEGYVCSDKPVPFVVDGTTESIELTVENSPQKGVIEIYKTGEILKHITSNEDGSYTPVFEEAPLQDAVFDIFAKTDIVTPDGTKRYDAGEKVDTVTTGESGLAKSKPLYLGEYEVKEVSAGENHVLNPKVYIAKLTFDGETVQVSAEVQVKNDRQKAAVTLVKHLEEDLLFEYGKDGYQDVCFGIYAGEEIAAQDGTVIPKDGLIGTAGVTEESGVYQGRFICDLPHGMFYVKEVQTANGYILDDAKYLVQFVYTDQNDAVVNLMIHDGTAIENTLMRGNVAGRKVDEAGGNLAGAVMGLFRDGERVFTEETALLTDTSDEQGAFGFEDVAYGKYIVRELKAPTGYARNTKEYVVDVTADKQMIEINVVNEITKFDIAKTDITTGKYVIGAQLSIIPLDENGNPDYGSTFATWITEEKEHRVEGLETGKSYMLRETLTGEAWDSGYVTAEEIIFTVPDSGEIQKVEMKDDYTKIRIQKVDAATGEQIPGAVLQILNPDGAVVAEFETTDTAYEMDYLPVGDYILRETKAPEGYVKAEDIPFTVEDTGEVQNVILPNEKIIVPEPEEEPEVLDKPEVPMQAEKPTPKTEEKEQSPVTGDEGHPLGWMMVAILGISGLIAGTRRKI